MYSDPVSRQGDFLPPDLLLFLPELLEYTFAVHVCRLIFSDFFCGGG